MKLNLDQIKSQLISQGVAKVTKAAFDDDMQSILDYYDRAYSEADERSSDLVKFVKSGNKDLFEFAKLYLAPQLTYGIGNIDVTEEIPGVITISYKA